MFLREFFGTQDNFLIYKESDRLVDNTTPIGIEIELENYSDALIPELKYWHVVNDGSLRPRGTGREFVSVVRGPGLPIAGHYITSALDEFKEVIDSNQQSGMLPTASSRCSVHIHIGVGNLTPKELLSFILVYLAFEKTLYKYADPTLARWNNNYCVPISKSYNILKNLHLLDVDADFRYRIFLKTVTKYDGANMSAIQNKGTVEFRMHPGCYDSERILQWINILLSIKLYAKQTQGLWLHMLQSFSGKGANYFLKEVFGPLANELRYPGFEADVTEGIRLGQVVMYSQSSQDAISIHDRDDVIVEAKKLSLLQKHSKRLLKPTVLPETPKVAEYENAKVEVANLNDQLFERARGILNRARAINKKPAHEPLLVNPAYNIDWAEVERAVADDVVEINYRDIEDDIEEEDY